MKNVIALFIIITVGYHSSLAQRKADVDYKPSSEWAWGKEDSTEYFIYTPPNLELGKKYPIALYLHGCCGQDLNAIPHRASDPPVRMWHNFSDNQQQIPTYIISPQTNRGWKQHFESIKKVIDFIVEKRQGDPQRIYITGFSMGGRGTFRFISEYPDYFAAAITIGMSFFDGDFEKIKDVPIWSSQGEKDWWARELPKFIKETRTLNGLKLDSAAEWITGVNPRYTSFKDKGHLIQWDIATTQNLTDWAYTKINDGNKYPQVYFESPQYRQEAKEGKPFAINVMANDPDGSIAKIDLFVNRQYHSTITQAPYAAKVKPVAGDNLLEAIAYDNQGKTSTATSVLVVDTDPSTTLSTLPYGRVGGYYHYWLPALGNGKLNFSGTGLPQGIELFRDGLLRGMPMEEGKFPMEVSIEDEDGDLTKTVFTLDVKEKREGEVLVTNVRDTYGNDLPISKMVHGELPNFKRGDKPSSFVEKNSFSKIAGYYGLTYIKSDAIDSTLTTEKYMSFEVGQDVDVLVAYEKMDNIHTSHKPDWLDTYEKDEKSEIVAQVRYYDVYSKRFQKGKISLPGGDRINNGVKTNYFVMLKPVGFDNTPEINIGQLPDGSINTYYNEKLSALYGHGKTKWKLLDGLLPEGLELNMDGKVVGIPTAKGKFSFTVTTEDEVGQTARAKIDLEIL